MLAIFAGPVQADPVAGRIDEDRFAPEPGLINGLMFEFEAARLQVGAKLVQRLVLEVHGHARFRRYRVDRMQRERGVAVRTFEPRIVGRVDDLQV